ncbi:MAG: isocitrate lyase/PEP mutase family protein [Pseudonocardiaceae bacterium]
MRSNQITPLIGVFDMLSASLAVQHYDGKFVSGFGFAASYYGLPDIGFIAWPDMVNFVQRLRVASPQQHLLVDIDDGYVDPEVACHVAKHLERIGASGVILEDQKRPRRCGHVEGKQILALEEYLEKLNLVLETREDLLVVARTDATEESDKLEDLGVNVAIYSTPCLFAAQTAIENALLKLRAKRRPTTRGQGR